MKHIFILLVTILTFASCVMTAKTKVVELEYQGENCLKEEISRIYLNDSVFIEYTKVYLSLGEISERVDTFKVIGEKWYRKTCETFQLYFDPAGFERRDTIILYNNNCRPFFRKIPQQKTVANGRFLYEFRIEEQHYNYFAPRIWFDPEVGTVRIVTPTLRCEEKNLRILDEKYLKKKALKNYMQRSFTTRANL